MTEKPERPSTGQARAVQHLSEDMRAFVKRIRRKWQLSDHHVRLLILAGEAHDRSVQAREMLAKEGITTTDRHGQTRAHPAVAVERDSRIAFARLMRELGLGEETTDESRPPRLSGRYRGRP